MEAPLAYTSNSQTLTYETSQSHVSYTERIKKRLQSLAAPPSDVVVLPSSSISEPAVSVSTATTGTTSTEPVDGRNTAATSVISLPRVFSVQKFYASPGTPMDEGLQAVWTHQIFDRLNQTLKMAIPTGTCLQEFMHMGRRANALKPTLVINCGDAHIKRQVEKTFKTQIWLQEILKAKGIMFVALVVKISPSAGPVSSLATTVVQNEAYAVELLSGISTSCGLSLFVKDKDGLSTQKCTLGGLITVDGVIVGLTTGHPFQPFDHHSSSDPAQVTDDLEFEESSETSSEPFVFNSDDNDTGDTGNTSSASSESRPIHTEDAPAGFNESLSLHNKSTRVILPSLEWQLSDLIICSLPSERSASFGDTCRDHDWALLENLPPAVKSLPNKVTDNDLHNGSSIDGIASSGACGSVIISVMGIGPQLGYLHSSPASMKIGISVLDVQLITLEQALPLGTSGAWVTLGDKLCGHIIAVRQDLPWAYMMAIERIFDNIKLRLGTDDVRLPTIAEINSAALSHVEVRGGNKSHLQDDSLKSSSSSPFTTGAGSWPPISSKSPPRVRFHPTERTETSLPEVEPRQKTTTSPLSPIEPRRLWPRHLEEGHIESSHQPGQEKESTRSPQTRLTSMPSIAWRRFETFILRIEHERRMRIRKRSTLRVVSSYFTHLLLPGHRPLNNGELINLVILNMPFNIMYLTFGFPFICWVVHRYSNVLEDGEVLQRRLQESFEFSGSLPRQYDDVQLRRQARLGLDFHESGTRAELYGSVPAELPSVRELPHELTSRADS